MAPGHVSQLMKHETPDLRDLGQRDLLRQQAEGCKMHAGNDKLGASMQRSWLCKMSGSWAILRDQAGSLSGTDGEPKPNRKV